MTFQLATDKIFLLKKYDVIICALYSKEFQDSKMKITGTVGMESPPPPTIVQY